MRKLFPRFWSTLGLTSSKRRYLGKLNLLIIRSNNCMKILGKIGFINSHGLLFLTLNSAVLAN